MHRISIISDRIRILVPNTISNDGESLIDGSTDSDLENQQENTSTRSKKSKGTQQIWEYDRAERIRDRGREMGIGAIEMEKE